MAERLQRRTTPSSCVTSLGISAQTPATFSKPLMPNPHLPLLHMVQHIAHWISPLSAFPSSYPQILPYFPFPPLRARDLGAIKIIKAWKFYHVEFFYVGFICF